MLSSGSQPGNFASEIILSENLIQNESHVTIHSIVAMNRDSTITSQQFAHQSESLVYHCDETVRSFTPSVTICQFFQDTGLFCQFFISNRNSHGKIGAHVKWGVNINEFYAALLFNRFSKGSIF